MTHTNTQLPAKKAWQNNNNIENNEIDSEEVENDFVEDNGKPMDGLIDDARKKVEAPPKKTLRKTGIWSGRKTDSPKRNVAFSPKTKVHYFDREDIEEVEHDNAHGDGVTTIKQRRHEIHGDGVRDSTTASGRGRLKNSVDDCIVVYMEYAAEAWFVVRGSCQKRLRSGIVKQKYLVYNRKGCPKGIHVDTLDLENSDKQKRSSNLHITVCKARVVFDLVLETTKEFCDVVSFDATFKTNKYKMVFDSFTAIDNHRKCVKVVVGLLKNETTHSYAWLLKAFIKAFGKEPSIVVTDQDGAIRNAIEAEFAGEKEKTIETSLRNNNSRSLCRVADHNKRRCSGRFKDNSGIVYGVRFVMHSHDEHRTTQSSGICSPGLDREIFYDVDAPPDIIYVVDEDDDIIDDEDPIPHVARGHDDDGGGDDRPPPYQIPTGCLATMRLIGPTTSGSSLGSCRCTTLLGTKFPEAKAGVVANIGTQFDLRTHMEPDRWPKIYAGIQHHLQILYNGKKAALKDRYWVPDEDETYDVEHIRRERIGMSRLPFGMIPKTLPGLLRQKAWSYAKRDPVDVARGHGGDSGSDDRPLHIRYPSAVGVA
nr:hypothetical protein [Tanacetum cinerariifolium]